MGDGFRWAVVLAAGLPLVGLAAYARGDELGSQGAKIVVVRVEGE